MKKELEEREWVRCHACGTKRPLLSCPLVPRSYTLEVGATWTVNKHLREDRIRACPNCMSSHLEPLENVNGN